MNAVIVRYQFDQANASRSNDLLNLLKMNYGGGVTYVADETIFIDTLDPADEVFEILKPMFTFDDKLFVGRLSDFVSMHKVSRTKPSLHKVAI